MKTIYNILFGTFCVTLLNFNALAQLTSTNLPIVLITSTSTIGTAKTQANMSIVNNATGVNAPTDVPQYSGMIGIELRGSSTNPKKSYSLETWSAPNVNQDLSLLGMPTDNDWVLLSSYVDRSLLRTLLSNSLHVSMGKYSPRLKLCEVLLDNQYQGVYLFGENIKRDSLRVDIAKLTNIDNFGENLTGGYIVKIDNGNNAGWISAIAPPYATTQQIKFQFDYPNENDITPVQKIYIEDYVDSFETAMNAANFQDTTLGWRKFGAVGNFIDFMIMQEVSKNEEAYRLNTYMYKDKGKKLRVGPLWTAELSWRNTADCNGSKDTGFCFNLGAVCNTESRLVPFWWSRLTQDTLFMKELKCQYKSYRNVGGVLDTTKIFGVIDSISTYANLQDAVTRNFTQWPIWGVPLVNEPTPMATNHAQEVANMKTFIRARLAWLDAQWTPTGVCASPASTNNLAFGNNVEIYPNPSSDQVNIKLGGDSQKESVSLQLYSIQGQQLAQWKMNQSQTTISLKNFPAGLYLLHIKSKNGNAVRRIVKE